ncbi:hypothetical protein SAMN05428975_1219 [Mucilaginibacter sp. OK268]|uniref:hypothetical protein n=1 Tax=Mucilaginibacter sp. OK268 TaxID=1881048 RepID=UPI000884E4BE|nr:hypothetical protein [Mucilaginibacter sp. OK268]SDP43890.1 hypothetical protein SAMN05428975_1219 [Mucilaginibacter sp. OK268]
MATYQFQETTISTMKALADKSVESFLNELNKKEEQTEANLPDSKTRELLDDFVCASLLDGVAEGKSFDQVVDHLASTIESHSTTPLPSGAVASIARAILKPCVDELSKMATNPEDFSLGDDKDVIRDAVIGWSRSARLLPIDQEEVPLGGAKEYPESFARVIDLPAPIIIR